MYTLKIVSLLVLIAALIVLEQCAWATDDIQYQYNMTTGQWEYYYVIPTTTAECLESECLWYFDFQNDDWNLLFRGSESDGYIIPSGVDRETE